IEAEQQAAEARRAALAEEQAAVKKVEAAAPPAAVPPAQEVEQVFPQFTFTVRNVTRSQLIRIREFMKQEGIQYE
ncbi:hypothetical protein, partial [uncultured Intestinimonas sp.]|uniref:hypothetical protein n=1 Tax=uncultured Intestinimonas sp. TaxID=1689265 RepID=UPI002943BF6C